MNYPLSGIVVTPIGLLHSVRLALWPTVLLFLPVFLSLFQSISHISPRVSHCVRLNTTRGAQGKYFCPGLIRWDWPLGVALGVGEEQCGQGLVVHMELSVDLPNGMQAQQRNV